jgi:hypothetical protein
VDGGAGRKKVKSQKESKQSSLRVSGVQQLVDVSVGSVLLGVCWWRWAAERRGAVWCDLVGRAEMALDLSWLALR